MDKVDAAIMRLREAAQMSEQIYDKPLVVTTSGGKDSSVCVALAEKAGIPFEVMHNHTTADAPETVYFIREELKRLEAKGIHCSITYPIYKKHRTSMWEIIREKGPPDRFRRYCCAVLKEYGGAGRFIVTGVRWYESARRKNDRGIYEINHKDKEKRVILNNDNDDRRMLFETCQQKAKRVCNPIIDWTDADVWEFLVTEHVPLNPLYKHGFNRVGCVGCPLASKTKRQTEFAAWPKYKNLYMIALENYIKKKISKGGKPIRENVEDLFHWWMEDGVLPGQTNLFAEE